MNKVLNKAGDVYGELTVLQELRHGKGKPRQVRCLCSCGSRVTVLLGNLRAGKTKSCGCALVNGHPNYLKRFIETKKGRKHLKALHDSLRGKAKPNFAERFWARVNKQTGFFSGTCSRDFGECWFWTGKANTGATGDYRPVVRVNGIKSSMLVTHVAYFLTTGQLPKELLMHICDQKMCCRPSHLVDTTPLMNSHDARLKRMGGILIAVPSPEILEGGMSE